MRTVVCLGVLSLLSPALVSQDAAPSESVRGCVAAAIEWIAQQARPIDGKQDAVSFPTTAEMPKQRSAIVYGGGAGILIFLENAAKVLGDEQAKALADRAYRGLLAQAREAEGGESWADRGQRDGAAGLYTGDAGVGQAMLVRALLRDDDEALAKAVAIGDGILARSLTSKVDGKTIRWWDEQVEVIYGASGTALFLLELANASKQERFREAAREVGRWLVGEAEVMKSLPKQRRWRWQLAGNNAYVGFSHGTAGVAYALLRVGMACEDPELIAAAKDGAALLARIAKRDEQLVRWPVVEGRDMSMGGWCHGPPGTARLFLLLHAQEGKGGDGKWLDLALASSRWVMAQAGPEDAAVPPAFPPSFCCGVAGALDYFCDLYRVTGDESFRKFALRAGQYLVDQAIKDGDGVKWANGSNAHGRGSSAHGVDLMGGASGAAFALLRLHTLAQEHDVMRGLPDRAVR